MFNWSCRRIGTAEWNDHRDSSPRDRAVRRTIQLPLNVTPMKRVSNIRNEFQPADKSDRSAVHALLEENSASQDWSKSHFSDRTYPSIIELHAGESRFLSAYRLRISSAVSA